MKKNVFGYAVGGGLEKAFSEHFTAKVEALHINLNTANSHINNNFRSDNRFTIVRKGLNWKF